MEQYGLEAASRGAKEVILCDNSKEAIQIIQKNIEKTHMKEITKVYQMSYEKILKEKIRKEIDIIYIDPPYQTNDVYKAVEIILQNNILKENSILIIETDQEEIIKKNIEKLPIQIYDQRKYGRANLIFLSKGNKT